MSFENERYVSNRTDRIEYLEEHIKKIEKENSELRERLDKAKFIIERAYFDPFDPFHKRLEQARIDWLEIK